MIERDGLHDEYPHWGNGSSADRDRRLEELEHERRVSQYIRDLPFLWINVDDEPSPESDRAYIERNTIALVSNYAKETLDSRSDTWLGTESPSQELCQSGLWNVNHVEERYDPAFLDRLETAVKKTESI
jgi:hypothetical protein